MIVLDTAAWIWFAAEAADLSPAARRAIEAHETRLVSSISAWEVGMLVAKARIALDRPVERWVDDALRLPGVEQVPVDTAVGVLASQLPGEAPPDPADRMIVATGLLRGCAIVTPDRKLRDYPFAPTIW